MIGVDKIGQIRRAYFEQQRSIKEIVRTLSVSRATVRKVIRGHKTEFKYERGVQPTPKLGDWVEVLTEILEQEAKLPKRERRSTQRLFEELRGRGYAGAHDSVHRFVKAWRDERVRVPVQAYVPMSFAPGEAYQFDWSPRDDHAPGPAADGQGGAHEAVAQPHALCARVYFRETHGDGVGVRTPLEGWSMGKSITATLLGILLNKGLYELAQPAPVPEWQIPGDPQPRSASSSDSHVERTADQGAPGSRLRSIRSLSGSSVSLHGRRRFYHYAATRPQQWPPNSVGRYHNTDPVLISYLIRLAVEKSGEEYLSFPQRALFDKLGIRTMRIETDPFVNFLGQGYEVGCGRDWARPGQLFTFKMASGTANAFCPQATRSSSAHRRQLGLPISVRFTVPFSGSMVLASIRSHESPITWRAPAAKLR